MDRLISLEPSNLVAIHIELGQKCYGELTLCNVMHTMPVAFRLEPVNKSRHTVKPHSGIIAPLGTLTLEIVYHLPPGLFLPESFPFTDDSFFLHSMVVPGVIVKESCSSSDSISNDWFTIRKKQVFVDSGIKILFVGSPVLVQLVMDGSMDEICDILERSDPTWKAADTVDYYGQSLLHNAITQSRPNIVQLLLELEPGNIKNPKNNSQNNTKINPRNNVLVPKTKTAKSSPTKGRGSSEEASVSPREVLARNGILEEFEWEKRGLRNVELMDLGEWTRERLEMG